VLAGSFLFSGTLRWIIIGAGVLVGGFYVVGEMLKGEVTRNKLILIFTIFGVGIFFIFYAQVQQTVFSADTINLIGEGDRVVITTSVGNAKDDIVVDLTQHILNQKLEALGWKVNKDVRISLDLVKFQEIYPLVKQENEVFKTIASKNTGNTFKIGKDVIIPECQIDRGLPTTIDAARDTVGIFAIPDLYCYYTVASANRAQVSGTGIDDYVIRITADGDTKDLTPNNKVAYLKNNQIEVSFEGSITAPQQIKQIPYDVLYSNSKFQHLISTASSIYTSPNYAKDTMQSCTKYLRDSELTKHNDCVNAYTKNLNTALSNKNNEFAPLIVKSLNFDSKSPTSGVLTAEVEPTKYPLLRIVIDGSLIGIERLAGTPDITDCVNNIDTVSGRELKDSLSVKNIGTQEGYFQFSSKCSNDNIKSFGTDGNVPKDATRTFNVITTVSSETPGVTERGTCDITITDKVSGKTDSCSYNVAVKFQDIICVPNEKSCSADNTKVLLCNSLGDAKPTFKTCSSDEHCGLDKTTNQIDCIKKSLIPTPTPPEEEVPQVITDNKEDCEQKAIDQPLFGWNWVEKQTEVGKGLFGIGALIGLTETKVEGECKAQFVPYYIFGGVILILGGAIIFLIFTTPKTTKRRRKR